MPEHWCACGEDINGHEWQAAAKRHLDLATEYRLRAEQAEATIQRVRELHTPYRIMLGHVPTDTNCEGCRRVYPCPTIRALDGER